MRDGAVEVSSRITSSSVQTGGAIPATRIVVRKNRFLVHSATWLAVLGLTGWVWAASERVFRRVVDPSSVTVREDVPYHAPGGHRLSLDIYLPPAATPFPIPGPGRPAILAIHGGSWIGGSKRLLRASPWNPHPTAIRLAESGFVVVAADYRLARPGAPSWPGARDDLREAVRWIRQHSRELGVDPGRIAVLGQSAGGHLAAMLGTQPDPADESAHVQAVVSFYGPSDLERLPLQRLRRLEHEPVRTLLGADTATASDKARDASPLHHVRRETAPMLLIHGTRDPWVPIQQSEELAGALNLVGVDHQFIRVEGARHGFDSEVNDPEVRDPRHRTLLPEVFAFLRRVWNVPSG
jgi:acetyl esterase/lipase